MAIDPARSLSPENKFGDYTLCKGWFVKKKLLGGYDAFKAVDLCWAYPTKVSTKAYGVVTTGVNWQLTMRIRPDKVVNLFYESSDIKDKLPAANVESTLNVLRQVAPWAVFGFSNYREECWRKDHGTFLKLIDERYEAVTGALTSGRLRVEANGGLIAQGIVKLPVLTFKFLRNDKGKVTGRVYQSSSDAAGDANAAFYQA